MKSKTVERLLNNTPEDVKIFVDLYADLVVRINQILRDKKLSQKELAERLNKKPSEISKWLNGDHNFTLRSLAKLQAELGETLLEVPKPIINPSFLAAFSSRLKSFEAYTKEEETSAPSRLIKWQNAEILELGTNVG